MLMFAFEATQNLIENLYQSNVKMSCELDEDSKEMLVQLLRLVDLSFGWEFTSSKRIIYLFFNLSSTAKIKIALF